MKLPQISEAEYEVMKIIWKHAPISTNQVTDILCRTTDCPDHAETACDKRCALL